MDSAMERSPNMNSGITDQTDRLYPSLPTERFEVCILNHLSANNLDAASARSTENLLENMQDEERIARMKVQMRVLEMQKQQLLSINEKWAKEYRTMVQYYKEKLRSQKAPLPQESCHDSGGKGNHLCKLNLLKDSAPAGCGDILAKTQSEARQLKEQNRALARRGQHQNEEIARLNRALEEALETSSSQEMSNETLQDIWKHQAEVYKEDFLKERKDREALKDKCLQLEEKYKKVRKELHTVRTQVTWAATSQPEHECTCTKPSPKENKPSTSNKIHTCYILKD